MRYICSDGEILEIDVEIAKQSVTVKTLLEDLEMDAEGGTDAVLVPSVNRVILKRPFSRVLTTGMKFLLLKRMRTK